VRLPINFFAIEIENPELAFQRMRKMYRAKGYSESWIQDRVRGMSIRGELIQKWAQRGIKTGNDFSILSAEIAKATFGITPKQHKTIKGLRKENIRDHMTDIEMIFSMLGEKATAEIAKATDSQGFVENEVAAKKGGRIAGDARKKLQLHTGKRVVSEKKLNLNTKDISQ
jgi:hypothetical protein